MLQQLTFVPLTGLFAILFVH